jgi:CTP:molybdopterin cytidylyltransferase MocA
VSPVVNVVIAAAGLGSRLGMGMPKAMIAIGGKSLLSRMLAAVGEHVQSIHVVVGYREEMIIEECARHHPHVVLVRNPDFRSTNTAHSYAVGAAHLRGKTLFIDGDLLLEPGSLREFIQTAATVDTLVGVTRAKSDNAVFASVRSGKNGPSIVSFSRDDQSDHEWANVVSGPADLMVGAKGYVFEHLALRLPCKAQEIDLVEVDTADDLARVQEYAFQKGL